MPHFPNLFCIYGPSTNLVVKGSRCCSPSFRGYILRAIEGLLRRDEAALDVRENVYESYKEALHAENMHMAWGGRG